MILRLPASNARIAAATAAALAAVLTVLELEPILPPAGAMAAPRCQDGWRRVDLPARGARLTDLSVSSGGTWLFGIGTQARAGRGAVAMRRSAGRWIETRVPLRGVSGLLAGDAERGVGTWAVGFVRPGVSMRPISMVWRGNGWANVRVPDPPGGGAALVDAEVLPSGAVWAVGTRLQGGRTRAYALRRRGGSWRRQEPTLRGGESGLTGVTSDPGGGVWAVGWHQRQDVPRALILELRSGRWSGHDLEGLLPGQSLLTDIAFRSARDGYAVGYRIPADGTAHVPLLARWDGESWTVTPLPWEGSISAVLRSVAVRGDGSLLVAGARVAGRLGRARGIHAQLRDDEWDLRLALTNPYHNSELLGSGVIGRRATVVGSSAIWSLALESCRPARSGAPSPSPGPRVSPGTPGGADGPAARSDRPVGGSDGASAASPGPGTFGSGASRSGGRRDVTFRDVARRVGLYDVTSTWGAVAADFDANGWPDVFYTRHNVAPPRLMLGGRRGFRRARIADFGMGDRHGCDAGDVDADGSPDLYCAHGGARGQVMKSNELWLALGRRRRDRATPRYGLVDPFGRGRTATFFHLDDDPYPELYVTNEPERVDGLPSTNRLFLNDAGARYLSAPQLGLDASMGGLCSAKGDVDGDRDDDLLVCTSEGWAGLPAGLRVFRNVEGRLRHATRQLDLAPIGDQDVVMADFDGDGRADDIAQLGTSRLRVSLGLSGGGFRRVFDLSVGGGVALAAGDVDRDGRADLYVVRGGAANPADLMLINRGNGRSFRSASVPQAGRGTADDVVVMDHDRNGFDDFLVLNGRGLVGPIQLIAAFPR